MPEALVEHSSPAAFAQHPAAKAWSRLQSEPFELAAVEALKTTNKSGVFRLSISRPAGRQIIAKRCQLETAATEHAIYTEFLPKLRIPSLKCWGLVQDQQPGFAWLFLEDAGPESFCPELKTHRAWLARYLARLHAEGNGLQGLRPLPDRGPRHYFAHLQAARSRLRASFANPALNKDDRAELTRLLALCDCCEENWRAFEIICQVTPDTLAHGDVKARNLRVRTRDHEPELLLFDWETAGWGTPAVDLAKCPDLDGYRSAAGDYCPRVARNDIERLADVGTAFGRLAAIDWETSRLAFQWVEWPLIRLRYYGGILATLLREKFGIPAPFHPVGSLPPNLRRSADR